MLIGDKFVYNLYDLTTGNSSLGGEVGMGKESLESMLLSPRIYSDCDFPLLFHYTSLEATCKIIESNNLKLGSLSRTNDPLEFCKFYDYELIGNLSGKEISKIRQEEEQAKAASRILCFCHDIIFHSDDKNKEYPLTIKETDQTICSNYLYKGWGKVRMWAQYADNHRGVCMVFDKDELLAEFEKLKNDGITTHHERINYSNDFSKLDNRRFKGNEINYLFQKCEDFRDENEYRFCTIGTKQEVSFDFGNSLKAIILGERVNYLIKINSPYCNSIKQLKIKWRCGLPILLDEHGNSIFTFF